MIDFRIIQRTALTLSLCLLIAACFPVVSGHEAFLERYGSYVGQSLKLFREQFNYKNGYSPLAEKKLGNGNIEIEIENALPRSKCKIFYEYNQNAGIIISWRYIGADTFGGCYVNPN